MSDAPIVSVERIQRTIVILRGQRVMLDADLAALYGVTTKRLNQQLRRNLKRFPEDFAFQLTAEESAALRSQFATSKGRGGRRYLPYAFTEHGAVMLASVLNTDTAVRVSVQIVRTFVALRQALAGNRELARRLTALEKRTDARFQAVFVAIRKLMETTAKPRSRIGFAADPKKKP